MRTAIDGFSRASGSPADRRSGASAPIFASGRFRSRNANSSGAAVPASGSSSSADPTVFTLTSRSAPANACALPAYAMAIPAATSTEAAASHTIPPAARGVGFAIIAGAAAAQLRVTAIASSAVA